MFTGGFWIEPLPSKGLPVPVERMYSRRVEPFPVELQTLLLEKGIHLPLVEDVKLS